MINFDFMSFNFKGEYCVLNVGRSSRCDHYIIAVPNITEHVVRGFIYPSNILCGVTLHRLN